MSSSEGMETTHIETPFHLDNTLMQYTVIFTAVEKDNFQLLKSIFSKFCSKHRLWVHVRIAVLMSTYNPF